MTITSKTTKAQLLQYIEELEAANEAASRALAASQPIPLGERLELIREELASAVNDAIRFERWCANGFQRIVDEFRSLRYN